MIIRKWVAFGAPSLIFIFLFLGCVFVFSQQVEEKAEKLQLDFSITSLTLNPKFEAIWKQPQFLEKTADGSLRILLNGSVNPGTTIIFGSGSPLVVDRTAEFQSEQLIPGEQGSIRIQLISESGHVVEYLVIINLIGEGPVLTLEEALLQTAALGDYTRQIWVAMGFNYLRYGQVIESIRSNLSYESFKMPSYMIKGRFRLLPRHSSEITFKDSPGEVTSSAGVQVNNGQYHWKTFTLEGLYFPRKRSFSVLGMYAEWNLRYGLQYHIAPFMVPRLTRVMDMSEHTMTMVTGGADINLLQSKRWRYETFMRYQYPLSAASTKGPMTINPKFAFDGSVALVYSVRPQWSLGAYWYGQWHEYSFIYPAENLVGSQSLFFSNMELRVGYGF